MAETAFDESCIVVGRNPPREYRGRMTRYDTGLCESDVDYYAAFLGIPYANVPKGKKRFQAPEPLPSTSTSTTMYDANVTGKVSAQLETCSTGAPSKYIGSEDCLYLNIFVPTRPELIKQLLPVLVFIHGGGFLFGSNDHERYTPELIIQHEILFVTINYRLGAFGFMNMHTEACPGNAGLKDQVKALEWIRDNIECFKGDPNNVTLSGSSAGATCVNLHLVAPVSKDLFHKAIVQSGGIFSTWGYRGHRVEQRKALLENDQFRKLYYAVDTDAKKLQDCACRVMLCDLDKRHPRTLSPFFGPSVEKFREEAFITDDIEEMMTRVDHDKPVIAGITTQEGLHSFFACENSEETNMTKWINDDRIFLQFLMDNFRWSNETASKFVDRIRNRYFPQRFNMSEHNKMNYLANLHRDIYFRRFYDNFKFGPERTVHRNLYVYRFDHFSEICQAWGHDHFSGATHGDELNYLYCSNKAKSIIREESIYRYKRGESCNRSIQEVMNHICSLWANFCKTGIPTSDYDERNTEWRRHTEEAPCYLSINRNLSLKEGSLFQNEWSWLNEIVDGQPTVDSLAVTPEDEVNQHEPQP